MRHKSMQSNDCRCGLNDLSTKDDGLLVCVCMCVRVCDSEEGHITRSKIEEATRRGLFSHAWCKKKKKLHGARGDLRKFQLL